MTKIRVQTDTLQSIAKQFQNNSSSIGGVGGNLAQAGSSARTYERNTFGPKVKSLCSQANAMANKNSSAVTGLSGSLNNKLAAFQLADGTYGGALNTTTTPLDKFLNDPSLIKFLEQEGWIWNKENPIEDVSSTFKIRTDQIGDFFNPEKNIKEKFSLEIPVWKDQVWDMEDITGSTELGGVRLGGKIDSKAILTEAGIGVKTVDGDVRVGAYGEVTGFKGEASGVVGSTDLGLGAGVEVEAGSLEGFAGLKDGNVGAKVEAELVSVEGKVGLNIAGWNVGISLEAGIQATLGAQVGKNTRISIGPFEIGIDIGKAMGS